MPACRCAPPGVGTSSAATRCPIREVRARVHHARADRGLLGELPDRRRLLRDLVVDGDDVPLVVRGRPEVLDRRRAVAEEREHLLAGGGELDRAAGDLRGERGDDRAGFRETLGAEAAADVRGDDPQLRRARGRRARRGCRARG